MLFPFQRAPSAPVPLFALILLAGVYLLAGVIGHDPWKGEDAIHLGIAYGFWQEGRWLVPRIAGEAWMHSTPLYHWSAALLGGLLEPLLAFHNGARLASTFFALLFLFALSAAARAFHGQAAGRIAPLLAIGTLGLLVPFHEAQPAVAGLAFAAMAWWGGGLLAQGRLRGAVLLGFGIGMAFATHGLVGLLMAIAVLPAPIFLRNWKGLLIALAIALPLALAWPLLLNKSAPGLLSLWWRDEWAEATLGRSLPDARQFELILWATWPVLPLALWGAWVLRNEKIRFWLPLAGMLLGLAWYLSGPARSVGLFPMLIPLILFASTGAERLRRGATNAFDWFGAITFSFVAIVIWLGASAIFLGWPERLARNFAKLAPGHEAFLPVWILAIAIAATIGWLAAWRLPRAPWRSSLRWAAGATMTWVLVTTLWMPWIEHYKSYRTTLFALRDALPQDIDCLERGNLGVSQRAVLDYYAGIRTRASSRGAACNWRLTIADTPRETPAGWTEVWRGGRPSDRKERWFLERRE